MAEVLKLVDLQSEINNSMDFASIDKQKRKLFEPVRIWCDYRSPTRLVIVLSKIDQGYRSYGNDESVCRLKEIEKAVACIRKYTEFDGENIIPIVPISIRITQEKNNKRKPRMKIFFRREEENIYAEPERNLNLQDGSLIACLKKILQPYDIPKKHVFSMASVDRPMRALVNNKRKTALQIRVVHGTLHKEDVVFLGPVLDKRVNEICYVKCTIDSLKADGAKEPSAMLIEGNVGGVIFKSISNIDGRSSRNYALSSVNSDSDIRILRSTILFAGEVMQGDIVVLEIYKKDFLMINGELDGLYTDLLQSLMPYDEITLFWYGKKILVRVIEFQFLEDKLCLSVILSKSQCNLVSYFALPCNKDSDILHYDNVLLAVPDIFNMAKTRTNEVIYTYISACIKGIKDSKEYDAIQVKSNEYINLTNILKGSLTFDCEANSKQEIVTIPIRSSQKKYSVDSIMTKFSKNLKKSFNRIFYLRAGGVEMYLIKKD